MDETSSLASFIAAFPQGGSLEEQIRHFLTGAMRAPSTHNSQPWRFEIQQGTVRIFRDTSVVLPNSDKETQYAHISIGFLLHHMETLGNYLGMHPTITLTLKDTLIAEVNLSPSKSIEEAYAPLAEAIFKRRNRRGTFMAQPIPADLMEEIRRPVSPLPQGMPPVTPSFITDPEAKKRIGELTLETMVRLYGIPAFRGEMSRWIVPSNSHRKTGIPGYSLNQPLVLSMILPSIIRNVNIGKLPGKLSAIAIASAPALVAFGARGEKASWVSIGYSSSRSILTLVARGFDASVYVATAELPDIRAEAMRLAGLTEQLRFLFAIGKLEGRSAEWKTPRVSLADKLQP